MSIRRSVLAAVFAALVASGAMTGCNDDEPEAYDPGLPSKSDTIDTTESTPEPSGPTPTEPTPIGPKAPAIPDAATAPGKKGAKAFVAYYIKLLNYASWTGDAKTVRKYGPRCRGCQAEAKLFETTYRRGGWFKGGAWTPVPSSWTILPRDRGYFVGVNVDAAKGLQKRRRGGEVTRFLADRIHRDFHLERVGQAWRVTYMEAEIEL